MLTVTRWVAAIVNMKAGPGNGETFTEEDWNTESSVADSPYRYSKVAVYCWHYCFLPWC